MIVFIEAIFNYPAELTALALSMHAHGRGGVLFKMHLYRIKNWQDIYEVNRTRELKSVKWIPLPVKLSGDGYCMLMEDEKGNRRKDGPAMFGTFISIVELAASCDPRGDLIRSYGQAHTFESIGRICRILPSLVEQTILFCVKITKWIEIIELDTNCGDSASSCEIGADAPVLLCNTIPVLSKGGMGGFENSKYAKRSKVFIPPLFEEFEKFCSEHGFKNIAKKAYEYYSTADWHDSTGKKIKSWKQKLIAVWFKDENRVKKSTDPAHQEMD